MAGVFLSTDGGITWSAPATGALRGGIQGLAGSERAVGFRARPELSESVQPVHDDFIRVPRGGPVSLGIFNVLAKRMILLQ